MIIKHRNVGGTFHNEGASVIFASQVIFASRVLVANIISLLRKQKYHYAVRHNITLCESTEYH